MKNKNKKNKKGFTLVEVLVAVLIVGILTAIAVPSYNFAVEKARATQGITTLSQIAKAQTAYNARRGNYSENMLGLPLDMKDQNGSDILGSEFADKYFDYTIYGKSQKTSVARRNNGEYELSVNYETGKIICSSQTENLCVRLGLEEGQFFTPGEEAEPCSGGIANSLAGEGFEEYMLSMGANCSVSNGVINYSYCENNGRCEEAKIEDNVWEWCERSDVNEYNGAAYYDCERQDLNTWDTIAGKYCIQFLDTGECEVWSVWDQEGGCAIRGDSWDCSSSDALENQITTERDGMTSVITCSMWAIDGECSNGEISMIEDSKTENGITYTFSCFGDLISNNACTSYNQMQEDDPANNRYRYCRWIVDNECKTWSFWHEYGVEYLE